MTDTLDEVYCPACGKLMKKILVSDENFNLDICIDGCGGIFFDNKELSQVEKSPVAKDAILAKLTGKTFEEVDKIAIRKCPICEIPMVKTFTSPEKKVEIDTCYNCGAVFLDNDELVKVVEEANKPESEKTNLFASLNKNLSPELKDELYSGSKRKVSPIFNKFESLFYKF